MPPPMSPQGSRAGLITAVVVLSILFVTSAIFAFYYSAEASKAQGSLKTTTDRFNQYASGDAQADPAVQALVDARGGEGANANLSAIQIALNQRDKFGQAIAGAQHPAPTAVEQAITKARAEATDKAVLATGVALSPSSSLGEAVSQLVAKVKGQSAELKQKDEQLAAAAQKIQDEIAQREQVRAELTGKFDEQGKQVTSTLADLDAKRTANDQSVAKIQEETSRALQAAQGEAGERQKEVGERDAKVAGLQKEIEVLKAKLEPMRAAGAKEGVVRQADGRIVRVPGNDNVFINLGQGDQLAPGMTFEVYDRFAGIPELAGEANDDATLPKGKASIEVVRVGPGQSEARIIRKSQGEPVIEGDVVANLVYDKNMKYNFVVFGDFDLDQSGVAKPGDAAVIQRLITQWGGKLQDTVNVNTDFVVLGKEPEVPVQESDESATDITLRENAQKQLDAYLDIRGKAISLTIPILNQNRFLYYVGYYEQAQR